LVRQAPATHGLARARWRLSDLRAALPALAGYSLSGIAKALKRRRIRLKRGRLHLHSPDPAYVLKRDQVAKAVALAHEFPNRITTIFGDECGIYRQPTLADRWFPRGAEPTAALSHRANTRHRLCAGLNAVTGRVVWRHGSKIGIRAACRWLGELRAAYPDRRLLLIWDNWLVHRHPTVLATAAALGIRIVWLPTYAPWLNPIEKLWRQLKQTCLHHHDLADAWDALKARVHAHLDQFAQGSPALLRYVGLWSD
jgi:hypothetical protein